MMNRMNATHLSAHFVLSISLVIVVSLLLGVFAVETTHSQDTFTPTPADPDAAAISTNELLIAFVSNRDGN